MTSYVFVDLPKFSLNDRYSGHWAKYHEIKKTYRLIVRPKIKPVRYPCEVFYLFEFRVRPLDNTNCAAMIKIIEDIIWPDDKPDIVKRISIQSFKSPRSAELKKKRIEMILTIHIRKYEKRF